MSLWRRKSRREKALATAPPGPLRDFLSHEWPSRATPVGDLRLLALDIETTGLDPVQDEIVSVGFVPVDGTTIDLSGAEHILVRLNGATSVGNSAVLHGLTDDVVNGGESEEYAITRVLSALSGRLMLVHFAMIETQFLSAACQRAFGHPLPLYALDTLELQRRLVMAESITGDIPQGALRLWAARERYGLPRYPAHDALVDALACAELFLGQTAELGTKKKDLLLKHLV